MFQNAQLNPTKCTLVLTKVLYLLNTGETFSNDEAVDLFFAVTKLFQSPDVSRRTRADARGARWHRMRAVERPMQGNALLAACMHSQPRHWSLGSVHFPLSPLVRCTSVAWCTSTSKS
jgi:hypothetical protein